MTNFLADVKGALLQGAPHTGGAKRKNSAKKSKKASKPAAAAKSAFRKTSRTVKCGDGVVRTVYMKDGKAYYRKKDSTGKLVYRVAPSKSS